MEFRILTNFFKDDCVEGKNEANLGKFVKLLREII